MLFFCKWPGCLEDAAEYVILGEPVCAFHAGFPVEERYRMKLEPIGLFIGKNEHGDAVLGNSRIAVWQLESFWQQGAKDVLMLDFFREVTPEHLALAREYIKAHPDEIAEAIRSNK